MTSPADKRQGSDHVMPWGVGGPLATQSAGRPRGYAVRYVGLSITPSNLQAQPTSATLILITELDS